MKKLNFTTEIKAAPELVWERMLGDAGYRAWTAAFMEGSYYVGGWNKGDSIRFLSPSGHGMVSEIADSRPHEYVSIRHLGMIANGVEDTTSEQVRAWTPAYENYTLTRTASGTQVKIEMDITEDFAAFMEDAWPKALAKLKKICEEGMKVSITPFLWFDNNAEDAVNYYLGIFPEAFIRRKVNYGKAGPGREGTVMIVDFSLAGQDYTALNGGPHMRMNGAVSFVIHCSTQQEIDHYWDKLGAGGQLQQCGWLVDKFGVTWQVVPRQLLALLSTQDSAQYERVIKAMMQMIKLEIAPLEKAAKGA